MWDNDPLPGEGPAGGPSWGFAALLIGCTLALLWARGWLELAAPALAWLGAPAVVVLASAVR